MSKTFDELFDDFLKRKTIKSEDKVGDDVKEEAKKMIDILTNFKEGENIDEAIEKEIDATLGKPDKIEFYNEGNLFIEKRIWYTANGDLVKLIVSDDPTLIKMPVQEQSLNDKLQDAIAEERFEEAAAIRDEIEKRKNNSK